MNASFHNIAHLKIMHQFISSSVITYLSTAKIHTFIKRCLCRQRQLTHQI